MVARGFDSLGRALTAQGGIPAPNIMDANNIIASAFNGLTLTDSANADAVADMLDRFGLRWEVQKEALLLPDGTETPFFAVVRQDTRQPFTSVKSGYVPYQNSELAELLHRVSSATGYKVHSGGMFNGGGKVYLQLETGNTIEGIGENRSKVIGYASAINSHDGTTSLRWGSVNFTICCKNTFAAAVRSLENSARHSVSIHNRVEESIRSVVGIVEQEKTVFERFISMSMRPASKHNIASVVKKVTGVDLNAKKEDASAYGVKRATELLDSIASEMLVKGDTMWGLFSGVTHYTSHRMPVPKRDNARLESKYVGTGSAIDNEMFALLS